MPRIRPDSLLFEEPPGAPDFSAEARLRDSGLWPVAGIDEAGRGPLAGPVVAAAVILDPERIPEGINDSKALGKEKRESLFEAILTSAHVAVASSSPRSIDATDIRKASLDAMRRALCGLAVPAKAALVDGRDLPGGIACYGEALIKGDARSLSIAAASIVAKVTRDRIMARSGLSFPLFGFEIHAGYGTVRHKAAIETHGPCPLHRMSFRPLRLVGAGE